MRKARFIEEQIIKELGEQERGVSIAEVYRRHGISWKSKFGEMDVSDARELKALKDENAELKILLAEAMLDNTILKGL